MNFICTQLRILFEHFPELSFQLREGIDIILRKDPNRMSRVS